LATTNCKVEQLLWFGLISRIATKKLILEDSLTAKVDGLGDVTIFEKSQPIANDS